MTANPTKLKVDQLPVVTTVGSPGDDDHIPTEKAVRESLGAMGGGDVVGPAGATDGHPAVFDGATGKILRDGGAPASGNVSDTGSTTANHLVVWNGTNDHTIKDGGTIPTDSTDPNNPDSPPGSPNAMDDEFNGSSLDGKWTQQNTQGATLTVAHGLLNIYSPSLGTVHRVVGGIEQTLPAGTWKFRCKVHKNAGYAAFRSFALAVRDSSTNHFRYICWMDHSTYGVGNFDDIWSDSGWDAYTGEANKGENVYDRSLYFEIEHDASNIVHWRISKDGWNFQEINSAADSAYVATPDRIGLGVYAYNASANYSIDWFRRIA